MALQFGYFSLASLRYIDASIMLMLIGMTSPNERNISPVGIDPKQIIFGVLSACILMMMVLLMCVLIAYLAMAAMQAF